MLSGFQFTDFTVYKLSDVVTNKEFTVETSGLSFALFYPLAQLNPAIKPNSLFQLFTQCLTGKGIISVTTAKSLIAVKYYSSLSRFCIYTSKSVKPALPWEINLFPEDKSTVLLSLLVSSG